MAYRPGTGRRIVVYGGGTPSWRQIARAVPSGISRCRARAGRSSPDLPEAITAGRDKDEARTLVLDALREYLLSIRGNGDAVDQ
jgi:hypothetical protein